MSLAGTQSLVRIFLIMQFSVRDPGVTVFPILVMDGAATLLLGVRGLLSSLRARFQCSSSRSVFSSAFKARVSTPFTSLC